MSRPGARLVLVTGGASGIGLAIARRFHQAGDQLVLADLNTFDSNHPEVVRRRELVQK